MDMTTTERDHGGPARFYVNQARADTWFLTVIGEIDVANHAQFAAALEQALRAEPRTLVFDLAGVRFMDSSGIGVLLTAASTTTLVEIRAPSRAIRRLIEVSGVSELFRIVE